MKRRKILGAMGVMGIPGIGKASSLYGTPVSITGPIARATEPLRLMFDTIEIPHETVPLMLKFGAVWERVLGNDADKILFRKDPSGFLEENGIPSSTLDARDQEVLLLKALIDEDVIKAAISGEYSDFLGRLKAMGISGQSGNSVLKKQVLTILKKNLADIKNKIDGVRGGASRPAAAYAKSGDIAYIYGQLAPSIEQVAMAAVPVAIAAIVAAYVSVVVAVTVGIMGGIYISLAVQMGVTISSSDCEEVPGRDLFAGPASGPQVGRSAHQRVVEGAIAQRELISKRMLVLSPERLQEAQQATRLARLLNQGQFVLESSRQLIRDEVEAVMEAAEEVGLLKIPGDTRSEVIVAIQSIALRATALD